MKNYYDQQQDLYMAECRLKSLKDKKQLYFEMTQPKAKAIKEVMTSSSHTDSDMFTKYASKVELIDIDIQRLEKEIVILKNYLSLMEESLRKMKGALEKIFVAKYIDGLPVNQIAIRVSYSESHVYRLLSQINQIIKDDNK